MAEGHGERIGNFYYEDNDTTHFINAMGKCWFISYAYYLYIDESEQRWKKLEVMMRKQNFYLSRKYHDEWFKDIAENYVDVEIVNLLEIPEDEIKSMAQAIVDTDPETRYAHERGIAIRHIESHIITPMQ